MKIIKNIIEYLKSEYKFIILCILVVFISLYKLPYNLYTGGGILDISDKVEVYNGYQSNGSFNMCYVKQVRATIPTYLLSYIFNWDREKVSASLIDENDTPEDLWQRERLYMDEANTSAVINAYRLANKDYKITSEKVIVLYLLPESITDLKVGDVILNADSETIDSLEDLTIIANRHKEGDKISFKVLRDGKEIDCYAEIIKVDKTLKVGIAVIKNYEYATAQEVKFNFDNNEAGPSGGLMLSLEIYNQLVSDDITNGYKIAGTGTIDENGNVGTIGGVKYKLKGAVNDKAKVFFVPTGNYDEAIEYKNKNNYEIEVVKVNNINEAINYLKEMK